jgi:hypothetical protein
MAPYKSGLCGIGAHEGDNPKNRWGNSLPTCTCTSQQCACDCHKKLDQMFEMTGQPRITLNFSSYTPDKGGFVMPDWNEIAKERVSSRINGTATAPRRIESADPATVPATIRRDYADTPSGRMAPGKLEDYVKEACDDWWANFPLSFCSPAWVCDWILDHKLVEKRPSEGAVNSVFNRWEKIGFAVIARKPVRFQGYTQRGVELTLEGCKEAALIRKRR